MKDFKPKEMYMLAIIRGLPGSGKPTFARHAFKNFNQLEADQFHMIGDVYDYKIENASYAHMLCQARCARHLKNGWDVVVANTFTTKFEILPYVKGWQYVFKLRTKFIA